VSLNDLMVRTAVLSFLLDKVKATYDAAREEAREALGPEGRVNATIDGNKLGAVSVSKTGRVAVNEAILTAWVAERYPDQIYTVQKVRPAFLDAIKKSSEAAGEPCTPDGTLDVPGVIIGDPYTSFRKADGGAQVIEHLWNTGRLTYEGTIKELE
jgi:hypothetical protein